MVLKMKFVVVLSAVFFCDFLNVLSERCRRRVCHVIINWDYILGGMPLSMKPEYCTHIVLHNAEVKSNQEIFIRGKYYLEKLKQVANFKKANPNLKIIFAIQNDNRIISINKNTIFPDFVKMYTEDNLKKNFIRNLMNFLRSKNSDGVLIDVQPGEGGNKEKFTQLFQDLKTAFIEESTRTRRPRLTLTAGIPSNKTFLDKYYDVLGISKHVDTLDLATNNFEVLGAFVKVVKHHSPLYSADPSNTQTIDYMSRYVAAKGVGKDTMDIGLSVSTLGFTGRTVYEGLRSYYHVCSEKIKDVFRGKYTKLDTEVGRVVTWAGDNKNFFDDPDTIRNKVKYAMDNGYGGVSLYYVSEDDDVGACGYGKYPLARAAYEECRRN